MDSDQALELSLGVGKRCGGYIPPSITNFLNHLSMIKDISERLAELNDYVSKLEQEMRKLDALKRNPQHCMLLLKDAVEFLKKEGEKMKRDIESREQPKWPAMNQFLPLKRSFNQQEERAENPMNCQYEKRHKSTVTIPKPCKLSIGGGGGGGAFTPFKARMAKAAAAAEEPVLLSLLPPGTQNSGPQLGSINSLLRREQSMKAVNCNGNGDAYHQHHHHHHLHHQPLNPQAMQQQQQQHQAIWKNNRRCWSPELHARFMAAMDFLGGPEVATPKQIRAVMQVEGLTNDQVKSHLQKYRLHNRGQHAEDTEPGNRQASLQQPWKPESYSGDSWSTRS